MNDLDVELGIPTPVRPNTPETPSQTDGSISSEETPIKKFNLSNMTTYQINGVTFTIEETAIERESETLYTKAKRKVYSSKERNELLDKIQKNQQTEFHSITVSVNDPEKMTNTHSLAKLLAENKRNLTKYDLHDVYHIVIPKANCFDDSSPDYGQLKTSKNTEGKIMPVTFDLFTDYLRLTPEQVALSSKWYSSFIPTTELMQENLTWSLAYYEKNVEATLYAKVYSDLLSYSLHSRGGPLFLKLLLNRVSTTNEANLKAIIHITETYRIKKSCKGENIEQVVELFTALYDNMASIKDGKLPEDALKNLLDIFQSTSVSEYNDLFKDMERQRLNNEIKASIDPQFAATLATPGVDKLANNIESIHYTLRYAERVYRTFVQKGTWDEILQRPPGQAAFISGSMGPDTFQHHRNGETGSNMLPIIPWTATGDCFNCGQPTCSLGRCPHELDPQRIKENKLKHQQTIAPPRDTKKPWKWRKPEPNENNRRVIDGTPHLFNPTAGRNRRGRWEVIDTPSDGQPNDGQPPQAHTLMSSTGSITLSTAASSLTNSSDPIERKLELKTKIAEMEAEYQRLG